MRLGFIDSSSEVRHRLHRVVESHERREMRDETISYLSGEWECSYNCPCLWCWMDDEIWNHDEYEEWRVGRMPVTFTFMDLIV